MNTASQNPEHHLGILRQKLEQGTDYEQALYYFLDEFAGDAAFMQQCEPEQAFHLQTAVTKVACKALDKNVTIDEARVFRLPKFGFYHGNAAIAGRVALFFYFDAIDTGLVALIPGVKGGTEIARFRLTGILAADPKHN
jgi:hypothetical protein